MQSDEVLPQVALFLTSLLLLVVAERLQRNLFTEFSSNRSIIPSDAELNRLPEQLLVRVGNFVTAPEFCRVAGTSKVRKNKFDSQN